MNPYYQDSAVTIYHGDARDILPGLPNVDLVLTDPPYGIGAGSNFGRGGIRAGKAAVESTVYETTFDDTLVEWGRLSRLIALGDRACVWGGNYYPVEPSSGWLVWDKLNGRNSYADCELAWTNYGIAVRLKKHLWHGMLRHDHEPRHHPTQKPLAIMLWCIELCPSNPAMIFDPFMGSGTTLRAAKDLGRRAIGIDLEEKYCEMAAVRMQQEVFDFQ